MVPDTTPGPEAPARRALASRPAISGAELNLPNLITLARLLSVPLAIWLILGQRYGVAFWVFVGAGISDALDGYIAKRWNRRTRLGAVLDPAADKALLTSVYVTLVLVGQLPAWLVFLVILRDFLIVLGYVVIRSTASRTRLDPLYISKINTLVQIFLIGFVLARLGLGVEAGVATALLIAAAAVTTVWSGLAYLARCTRLVSGSEPLS
jgi:cardiolipin synthase